MTDKSTPQPIPQSAEEHERLLQRLAEDIYYCGDSLKISAAIENAYLLGRGLALSTTPVPAAIGEVPPRLVITFWKGKEWIVAPMRYREEEMGATIYLPIDEHTALLSSARAEARAEGVRQIVGKLEDMMSERTTEEAWKLVHEIDQGKNFDSNGNVLVGITRLRLWEALHPLGIRPIQFQELWDALKSAPLPETEVKK